MSFDQYKNTPGRSPATLLELDLDFCTRSYGVSPCAATLALRNDLNWSQEFDQTTAGPTPGWLGGLTTANAINAPDGTLTADEIARVAATPFQFEEFQDRTIGLSVEANHTAQAFRICVKPKLVGGVVSERYFGIAHFSSGTQAAYAWFDIQDGHSMGAGGSNTVFHHFIRYMEEAVEPGWYEVGFIYDSDTVPGTAQLGFFITNSNFDIVTSGDIGDGVYVWGAQVRPVSPIGETLGNPNYVPPIFYGKYAVRQTAVVDGMGDGSADLCYNTFATCQDTANFDKEARTLKFIDTLQRPPQFLEYYPAIKSVTYAPTVLKPGGNLSIRGQVTVTLQDFATGDNDIDDYAYLREYDAELQGTFFGKLKARQLYYIGRPMRVREGYLDDFPLGGNPVEYSDPLLDAGAVTFLASFDGNTAGAETFTPEIGPAFEWNLVSGSQPSQVDGEVSVVESFFPGGKSLYSKETVGVPTAGWQTTAGTTVGNFAGFDFTLEVDVYIVDWTSQIELVNKYDFPNRQFSYFIEPSTGRVTFSISTNGSNIVSIFSQEEFTVEGEVIELNEWNRLAICRSGNNWYLFLNGKISDNSPVVNANSIFTPGVAQFLVIGQEGADDGSGTTEVYFDNIRITEGFARYTENYEIPGRVYPGSALADSEAFGYRTREYIIDDISGPTDDGRVTIKGKDILSLAADVRAKAPTASTGTLLAGITNVQTTATLAVGTGSQYSNGDNIRINDEIITITTIVGDNITAMVRGQGGTTGAAHNAGDAVQLCLTYTDEPLIDVIEDLLTTYANVPSSFIPMADWELEEAESLSGYLMTTIISEPTGVLSLLKELAEITLIDLWYDDTDQEIKLKLQTPFTEASETVNDDEHILKDSLKVKDLNKDRLTRVLIYYGIRNFARDLKETENYSLIQFDIDADKEGVNKYNDERIKTIFSRWFDSSNTTQVQLTAQRLLDRFGITPKQIMFDMDAKDVGRIKTGDVFDLTSRIEQDVDGSDATNRYQITEEKTVKSGSIYRYKAEAFFQDPTPDSLTITTNQTDYDVFVELGGPPGPVDVTLTINAAVRVHGTNGNPAITTEGMHPDSTLTIVNNGEIYGHGGDGGNGRNATVFGERNGGPCFYFPNVSGGQSGQQGGDAVNVTCDVEIDNTNGEIFGGGGGGGGGDGWASPGSCTASGGGGGGGGQGEDTAAAGAGGSANASCPVCGPEVDVSGLAGTGGSVGSAGTGGTAAGVNAGDGGDGGDWGEAGDAGGSGGFAGGAGGFAVRLNGNGITWLGGNTAAKVKGTVG